MDRQRIWTVRKSANFEASWKNDMPCIPFAVQSKIRCSELGGGGLVCGTFCVSCALFD